MTNENRKTLSGWKKYTALATAGIGMLAGGLANKVMASEQANPYPQLPLSHEQRTELVDRMEEEQEEQINKLERQYKKGRENLRGFHSYFLDSLEDGNLTLEEQGKAMEKMQDVMQYISKDSIPAKIKSEYKLIGQNYRAGDLGTPKLEKALNEQGKEVKVERRLTAPEIMVGSVLGVILPLGIFTLYESYRCSKSWEKK